MTRARGRVLLGVLAFLTSAAWGFLAAGPAAAAVCAFDITSPAPDSELSSADVRVTGRFEVSPEVAQDERSLKVTFLRSPGPLPATVEVKGADVGPAGQFDVGVGGLTTNGLYQVKVTATHDAPGACVSDPLTGGPTSRSQELTFGVNVRAQPPTNVRAAFDAAARTVTVTWAKSSDPDIAGYTITRKVGTAPGTAISVGPGQLSWTDRDLPAGAATIAYSVQAARNGARPGTRSALSTPLSATVQVPARPPASTPTSRTGGAAPASPSPPAVLGPSTGGTTTLPPAGAPAVLENAAGLPAADPAAGGYQSQLQYDDVVEDPGGAMPVEEEGGGAGERGDRSGGEGPAVAYLASGLLSALVAAQILWLRRPQPDAVVATRAEPPLEPVVSSVPLAPVGPPPGVEDQAFERPAEDAPRRSGILAPSRDGAPTEPVPAAARTPDGPPPGLPDGPVTPVPAGEPAAPTAEARPRADRPGAPERPVLVLRPIRPGPP